jgi:hypothetical protein
MHTLLVMVMPSVSGLSPVYFSKYVYCSSDYLSPDSLPAFICSCCSNPELYSFHGALKLIISEIAECVVMTWLTIWMLQRIDKVRNLSHSISSAFV